MCRVAIRSFLTLHVSGLTIVGLASNLFSWATRQASSLGRSLSLDCLPCGWIFKVIALLSSLCRVAFDAGSGGGEVG